MKDDPRPGAMDPTVDPRPWWQKEFARDLFQRLDRRDAEVDRRFDSVERKVDSLERDFDERTGARKGGESWRLRSGFVIGAVAVLAAIVSAIAAIAQLT